MCFSLALCEVMQFHLCSHKKMSRFQNSIVLVTKAEFEGSNSQFLHILDIINNYKIMPWEQKLSYIEFYNFPSNHKINFCFSLCFISVN